jgi:hypothetical protein
MTRRRSDQRSLIPGFTSQLEDKNHQGAVMKTNSIRSATTNIDNPDCKRDPVVESIVKLLRDNGIGTALAGDILQRTIRAIGPMARVIKRVNSDYKSTMEFPVTNYVVTVVGQPVQTVHVYLLELLGYDLWVAIVTPMRGKEVAGGSRQRTYSSLCLTTEDAAVRQAVEECLTEGHFLFDQASTAT